MHDYWYFARRMVRGHRPALVIAFICAFLSAGGLGGGILACGPLLGTLLDPQNPQSLVDRAHAYNAEDPFVAIPAGVIEILPTDPGDGVRFVLFGLALLTLFGAIANFFHQFLSQTVTTRVIANVRREGFARALSMPLVTVMERGASAYVARLVRDAAELQRGLIALVSKAVSQITKGMAAFGAALYFDWQLTLTTIVVAPLLAITLRKVGKRIRRGTRASLYAQEGLLRIANERLQGLRSVKAGTAEDAALAEFSTENENVYRHELRIRTARALSGPLVELIAVLAITGVALVAARSILSGTLTPKDFIITLGALGVAGSSFRPLTGLVTEIQAASAPAGRLRELLGADGEPTNADGPELPLHTRTIAFDDVHLSYPGSRQPALRGITTTIDHGMRVAVVGPNGSGKTTLVSLLPRLLVPTQGRVLVDDVDIATVRLDSLRRQIAVVTQDTVLFEGTIAENLRFGNASFTDAQLRAALAQARALDFVDSLPDGLEHELSEQGSGLSGGQRQRLAIARAILREPAILILDEATSQVDAESEAAIADALVTFCAERTSFIVAHRLATVLGADRILVFEDGRIVGDGTHDALLESCALYRRLTKTQLVG